MNRKLAFIFPGQGAQYVGMGKDFYENFPVAKQLFIEANDLLHFDLSKIIFEDLDDVLKKTVYSQIAIFVTSAAILEVVRKEFPSLIPNICSGLSLGEYTALFAANKLSFRDTLMLVQKRAKYMNDACEATQGAMAAVIGIDSNIIEEALAKLNPPSQVWTANYNTADQTVISGTVDGVNAATVLLNDLGARKIVPLQVHGAFHSGLMIEAQKKLQIDIDNTFFKKSDIDIIMNVPATFVTTNEDIKNYLTLQVTNGVKWKQSIDLMEKSGIDVYLEIGPSKTLSMMNRKNKIKGSSLNIDKISDLEKLANEIR